MILKASYEAPEDIPEGLQEAYVERNGVFELQVEGMKGQGDVDRLQNALSNERAAHRTTREQFGWVGDLTPEDLQTLRDTEEDLKHQLENAPKAGLSEEQIEERAEKLAARKTRALERQIEGLSSENHAHLNAIGLHEAAGAQRSIRDSVDTALTGKEAVKVVDSAREDILPFAERIMTINERGDVVTKDNVGFEPGLSFAEVLTDLQTSGRRAHWFPESVSAGASGGKPGQEGAGPNPFATETFNLTQAMQLKKDNPARALALAKASGQPLRKFGFAENS